MKIGMNLLLWTDHPTKKHGPLLEKIKKWGFDGVEFPVISMEKEDITELAKRCDDLGLGRSAILAFGADQADPVNPDPKLRQAAVDLLKRSIDKTRDIGADILVGPIQQGLGRFTGTGPTVDEWKRAASVIREAAQHASTMHIDLAVEPLNRFEMFLFNTIGRGAQFCQEVNMPNVGLLADTHHSNIEEQHTGRAWGRASKQIFHVHISENHRGVPGQGRAVTPDVFRALRRSSYDRWLTIEAFGLDVPSLIPALNLWRPLFENVEDVPVLGLKHIQDSWNAAG